MCPCIPWFVFIHPLVLSDLVQNLLSTLHSTFWLSRLPSHSFTSAQIPCFVSFLCGESLQILWFSWLHYQVVNHVYLSVHVLHIPLLHNDSSSFEHVVKSVKVSKGCLTLDFIISAVHSSLLAIVDDQAVILHGHSVKGFEQVVCYENTNETSS